jgi:hydrogenase expression/formation protein HypD
MRYLSEFRDGKLSKRLSEAISAKARALPAERIRIMEVCGTHTVAIFRSGLRGLLAPQVVLLSGPGCPVCVTPIGYIDHAIELGRIPGVIIATFGDMVKVPGSYSNLERERARGADIRVVYSVTDAAKIAESEARKKVVFLGVGFETTAPTIASAIIEAQKKGLENFYVLSAHKLIPPAMEALLSDRDVKIDAFLCPGHVSVIIGARSYAKISEKFKKPCVVSGFEPLDVLQSILMILTQISEVTSKSEIQYTRCVTWDGNTQAQRLMESVFEVCDANWRGLGVIPRSGLKVREEFATFDASLQFEVKLPKERSDKRCLCGEILRGVKTPPQCGLFAKVCTPENPVGPCMVSSEGTCSAYFKYRRKE